MALVENLLHRSLDNIPPCLNSLANFKVNVPARSDIEDGLCCPDDQILFLTASMSFLHTHLMRKLSNEMMNRKNIRQNTYSNLLILENNSKSKQTKYYLKLKNIDRYYEVLQKEASIPSSTLSLSQILPQPKKSKTIFKLLQKMSINNEKKSKSTYNLFKNHGDGTNYKIKIGLLNNSIQTIWTSRILQSQNPHNIQQENTSASSTSNFKYGLNALTVNRFAIAENFKKPVEKKIVTYEQMIQKYPDCLAQDVESNDKIKYPDYNLDQVKFEREKQIVFKINTLTKSGGKTKLEKISGLNNFKYEKLESGSEPVQKCLSDISTNSSDEFQFTVS